MLIFHFYSDKNSYKSHVNPHQENTSDSFITCINVYQNICIFKPFLAREILSFLSMEHVFYGA